ncbi:MAG: hypothetical protein AAFU60_15005, partial [Bacteroidota bacterium]
MNINKIEFGPNGLIKKEIPPEKLSEELQEIIGRPPHWLVRLGLGGFCTILVLILFIAWWIEYPEVISVPFKLTSVNAPKAIASKMEGRLEKL